MDEKEARLRRELNLPPPNETMGERITRGFLSTGMVTLEDMKKYGHQKGGMSIGELADRPSEQPGSPRNILTEDEQTNARYLRMTDEAYYRQKYNREPPGAPGTPPAAQPQKSAPSRRFGDLRR